MFGRDEYSLSEIYINNILLEAKDVIKSNDPKELLAKFITGSSLYQSNEKLRSEADSIANNIINQIEQIQKEKNKKLFSDKDLMSLVNSLLMMSGTQQYVNQINGDESKVNLNLYNRTLPVLLHDYKDALDKSETLLNDTQFVNMFQKGIPRWMDIVHSIEGKEKHKPQEIKASKTEESLFENDEVIVYLGNDIENPVNGVKKCKLFGKGSTLCISGSNAAYHYHDYRWNDKLTTYFCYLKKREHYMLVDVTEDNDLQYNPMFENGKRVNNDISVSKEKLLQLYPELTEPFNKNVFVSIPIEGREYEFYNKFYNVNSILNFGTPEDRLTFASFKDIKPEEWNQIPKEEWGKILEYAIYVTEDFDIPDYVFEGKPRLHKEYFQNVKRRVETEVKEWNSEDELDFTTNELLSLKDIEEFSDDFLSDYGNSMWFLAIKKDDPKFNKNLDNVVKEFLKEKKHKITENGDVILEDDFKWDFKYVLFPFNLIKCKDIEMGNALILSLPQLTQSENIYAYSAQTITLPQLTNSGDIIASSAQTMTLPQLKESGEINAYSAQTISLPQLKKSRNIYAESAQTISLPQLTKSGDIGADSAQTITLPQLTYCGNIYARSTQTLSLPQLIMSRDIFANSEQTLSLPQLTKSGYIYANSAQTITLPQLTKSGDIIANSAQTITLPQLTYGGDIESRSAHKIIIKHELINNILYKKEDVQIIDPSEYKEELNDSYIFNLMRSFLLKS